MWKLKTQTNRTVHTDESLELIVKNRPASLMIYIDDSNLWIGSKQAYGRLGGDTEKQSWRIDMPKLLHVIGGTRHIQSADLYASSPPDGTANPFWEAMERQGLRVHVSRRSTWTGKEKAVDAEIVSDIARVTTTMAMRAKYEGDEGLYNRVLALVTGDGDLHVSVRDVLRVPHLRVEVWCWKHCLARKFNDYLNDPRVSVHFLDDHIFSFGYVAGKTRFRGQ